MTLVHLIVLVCCAYTEAVQVQEARSFGNFVPKIPNSFDVFKPNRDQTLNILALVDPISAAISFFASHANVPTESITVSSSHKSKHNGVTHVYLQQIINGLHVSNGVGNVNVKHGRILSVGNSFYTGPVPEQTTSSEPKLSAKDAVAALGKFLNFGSTEELSQADSISRIGSPGFTVSGASFAVKEIPAVLKYIQLDGGVELCLAWALECKTEENMYKAFVDANKGEVVGLIDWVSDASYNVLPFGTKFDDPISGKRSIVNNPADPKASRLGWHDQGHGNDFTTTIGNNVYAQENFDGGDNFLNNHRPDGGEGLNFDFPLLLKLQPRKYVNAAITNLFYWNNIMHDLFYKYGFTEDAGNFQDNNFGLGGEDSDPVIAQAQDGSGFNNANFATPPDGDNGRMRMYVWTKTNPRRDGDLDGGIVMHEYGHGISNRLTGGGANVDCLPSGESAGMGEGWSDTFATITRVNATTNSKQIYEIGAYLTGGSGVRKFPYATDMKINPSTYGFLRKTGYKDVHAKGEVWAVMLYDVFWNLVKANGFESDWFNEESKAGNIQMLQLIVDGLKLQPCNPNFVQARDAILDADEINYNKANRCLIWKGFAKRGLGEFAAFEGVENFDVPVDCL